MQPVISKSRNICQCTRVRLFLGGEPEPYATENMDLTCQDKRSAKGLQCSILQKGFVAVICHKHLHTCYQKSTI